MQKLICFLTLFLLSTINIYSQSGWFQQYSGTTNSLRNVTFVNANTGYILNIPFLKTTNGGTNWVSIPGLPSVTWVSWADANTGYGANETVYKTTNGGLNWVDLNQTLVSISGISFINNTTGYLICEPEYFLDLAEIRAKKTTNGGLNWNDTYVFTLWENPLEYLYLVDIQAVNLQVAYFTAVYEHMLGVTHWSRVYKTVNGGQGWSIIQSSTDTLVYTSLVFPSPDTGYVVTSPWSGPPFATTHHVFRAAGGVWTDVFASNTAIRGIAFPTTLTGYVLINAQDVYKTTNAGQNWSLLSADTATLNNLYFINPSTGWAVGQHGEIFKTTTGGEPPVLNSISGNVRYQDNNNPVTAGYVKALRYDSLTYSIVTVDSAQIQSNGAYTLPNCPPITLDIMAYENDEEELSFVPTYYVSTINWENATHIKPDSNLANINIAVKRIVNPGGNLHIGGFVYSNSQIDYVALKDAVIYSRSAGIFKSYSISIANGSYRVDSLQAGVYELIVDRMGYDGQSYVVSLTNSSLENINFYLDNVLLPVNDPPSNIPEQYCLEQNFPNPFNPVTKIRFAVPSSETSNIELFIYDILGRQIAKLVDSQLKPGMYEVEWNAADYPSGVYFYSMEANGFKDTKKMVLLK